MPENQVEIVFRTRAELEGALAAQAELERTRGKLLALGKDTAAVDAQLERAGKVIGQAPPEFLSQQPPDPEAAARSAGHASEQFKLLNLHGREFHKLIHAISHASPLLGEALRLAINPVTGLLFGGVLAIKEFHDWLGRLEEQLKIGGAWKDSKEAIEAESKAFEQAELSASSFERSLMAVKDVTKQVSVETERHIMLLKQGARQQDEERSAELAAKKAEIDAKVKAGQMSELEGIKARAELEKQFAREKLEREAEVARGTLEARQKERESLRAAEPGEEAGLRAAQRAFALAEPPEAVRARIKTTEEHLAAGKEELKKAEEAGKPERIEKAKFVVEQQEAILERERAEAFAKIDEFNALKEELAARESRVRTLRNRLDALGTELEKLVYATEADIASRATVQSFREKEAGFKVGAEGAAAAAKLAPGVAAAATAAGSLNQQGLSKAEAIAQAIEGQGLKGSSDVVSAVIERFTGTLMRQDEHNQQLLRDIQQRLADAERRIANARTLQN